jgi:N4-gp56 family major capsid protein
MAQIINKFNQGGTTSSSINRQFTPEFVTKAVAEMAPRKRFFSQRSNPIAMPKNYGDTLTKEVRLPILHKDNLIDANIDASTATAIQNMFIAYNSAGAIAGTYDVSTYAVTNSVTIDAARTACYNAAVTAAGAGGKVKMGSGYLLNGKADYAVAEQSIPVLPEEGGVVGLLNSTSKLVSAKITFHAIGLKYTVRSVDLDSRKNQVAQKIKDLSRATHELKEIQVQNSIIAASEVNRLIASTTATTISQMTAADILTYDALQGFEQALLAEDVPMDTEIIEGTTKIDTKVVEDGWVVYINRELMPAIRKVKGPDGTTLAFIPKSQYAAGTMLLDGEFGAIGSFRFVVVPDLPAYRGKGSSVSADTATDKLNRHATGGKYDIFPMIVVGSDSFSTTGFTDKDVTAAHIPPTRDVYNDMSAQVGGVVSNWTYGFLNYRPERIRQLAVVAQKV